MTGHRPPTVRYHVDPLFRKELEKLPWSEPIAEWHRYGVVPLDIKRGPSRHTVIFVRTGRFAFGIKEISEETSRKETENYERMLLMGIHTLVPAGYVVREEPPLAVETPIGTQYEENNTAHTVTLLVEKVIPDSLLYSRNFRRENRRRILDAAAELFVQLHANGVYWGDASLANTLIKFEKRDEPFLGLRTVLRAYLADAETVEIRPKLSASMREADLAFFFESMEWIDADLRTAGLAVSDGTLEENRAYVRERYDRLFAVERKKRRFLRETSFSIDRFLGGISDPSYVDLFLKHIEEHKWYMSERASGPVTLADATRDWYETVFVPVCRTFREGNIGELFRGRTAAELYIDIMTNKYFLSQREGRDVGMAAAMRDYAERFGVAEEHSTALSAIADNLLRILGLNSQR